MQAKVASSPFFDDPLAPAPLPAADEAHIAQEFMLTRRLRIVSVISLAFGCLLALFLLVYVAVFAWQIPGNQSAIGWLAVIVLVACDALFFSRMASLI